MKRAVTLLWNNGTIRTIIDQSRGYQLDAWEEATTDRIAKSNIHASKYVDEQALNETVIQHLGEEKLTAREKLRVCQLVTNRLSMSQFVYIYT